jgi:hypothetical protein
VLFGDGMASIHPPYGNAGTILNGFPCSICYLSTHPAYRHGPASLVPNTGMKAEKCSTPSPLSSPQVLDAPALQDDFYLNLVDWSAQNVLAVGLGPCVYLWSACTSKVGVCVGGGGGGGGSGARERGGEWPRMM